MYCCSSSINFSNVDDPKEAHNAWLVLEQRLMRKSFIYHESKIQVEMYL